MTAGLHKTRDPRGARQLAAIIDQWHRREVDVVTVDLPYPPSVNALWQRSRTGLVRTPRYKTWFRAAGNEINRQRPGKVRGPFSILVQAERQNDGRRHDLDNLLKPILDLLQEHDVVDDDCLAEHVAITWGMKTAGVHVVISAWRTDEALLAGVAA